MAFCEWLSEKTGLTYRLPTDAEWFHAANAQGLQPTNKDPNCRVKSNVSISSFPLPTTIGKRRANGWGLQNYLGNVREWTVGGGNTLYVRGGSFQEPIEYCDLRWRVADKGRPDRATGFRLVREMAEQ